MPEQAPGIHQIPAAVPGVGALPELLSLLPDASYQYRALWLLLLSELYCQLKFLCISGGILMIMSFFLPFSLTPTLVTSMG